MSNAGDRKAVLLNHLRSVALAGSEEFLFHAEWSATEGCELDDEDEWAQANPSLGYPSFDLLTGEDSTLRVSAIRASLESDPPNVFRTEVLCQNVDSLNAAIDMAGWIDGTDAAGPI